MTHDGLIKENQTTGDVESVSERDAEQNLSPQQFIQPDETAPPSALEPNPAHTGRQTVTKRISSGQNTIMKRMKETLFPWMTLHCTENV